MNFYHLPYYLASGNLKMGHQRLIQCQVSNEKYSRNDVYRRLCCMPVNVEESSSLESEINPNDEESASKDSPEELLAQPLSSEEVCTFFPPLVLTLLTWFKILFYH